MKGRWLGLPTRGLKGKEVIFQGFLFAGGNRWALSGSKVSWRVHGIGGGRDACPASEGPGREYRRRG